ncbi:MULTISPECIES: hypothetical protein [unclassified Halomonas]|uniref:hypothetical protein n=1 Tax=unclassified Halomonas TaxID=2609666 RepID=UPI0007DA0C00|nr:hypothetical protein [Halomonas sp. ALS9]MBT2786952.1 hypothetical protein [Halomonas sp. ISL-106]MBT2798395.1 hypothetical protein [Halomonas sp. ISL-104]OAL58225.1 hypothetical protein A6R74_10395 [Halomonas sp. ALS9]
MNQEVTRRHYLDAMGITAWAAKYQLPNALPTESCEWEDATPAPTPPRERLQALLDDAPAPRRQTSKPQAPEPQTPSEAITSPTAVRALLGQDKPAQKKPAIASPEAATPSVEVAPATPAKPLKFELSCVCLEGRWLVLQAGEMSVLEQQLLANLLQAVGIQRGTMPEATRFTWPQMANAFVVEDPLDEAREGLAAFIAGGVSRQGWQLERLLWWGELEAEPDTESRAEQAPLDRILNVADGQSQTLSLPLWQGPTLASLLDGSQSKRDLWPALQALGQLWAADAKQATDDH